MLSLVVRCPHQLCCSPWHHWGVRMPSLEGIYRYSSAAEVCRDSSILIVAQLPIRTISLIILVWIVKLSRICVQYKIGSLTRYTEQRLSSLCITSSPPQPHCSFPALHCGMKWAFSGKMGRGWVRWLKLPCPLLPFLPLTAGFLSLSLAALSLPFPWWLHCELISLATDRAGLWGSKSQLHKHFPSAAAVEEENHSSARSVLGEETHF